VYVGHFTGKVNARLQVTGGDIGFEVRFAVMDVEPARSDEHETQIAVLVLKPLRNSHQQRKPLIGDQSSCVGDDDFPVGYPQATSQGGFVAIPRRTEPARIHTVCHGMNDIRIDAVSAELLRYAGVMATK
jgi:hypothetical protein